MYKSLVIGGSGFLGSHLADYLLKKKHIVSVLDIKKSEWIQKKHRFIKGNILNPKILDTAIQNKDYVFMFAGLSDLEKAIKEPLNSIKLNIFGSSLVAEKCIKHRVKRLIYASSIYSNSMEGGFYRCSKRSAEDYILEYSKIAKLKFTILRYGSLYGPRSDSRNGMYKMLKESVLYKKAKYYGYPFNQRKYLHVEDATKFTYKILKKKYENRFINLVGNKTIKISKLLDTIEKLLKFKIQKIYLKKNDIGHYVKKPTTLKINSGINVNANPNRDFEESMKDYISYFKKNLKIK